MVFSVRGMITYMSINKCKLITIDDTHMLAASFNRSN